MLLTRFPLPRIARACVLAVAALGSTVQAQPATSDTLRLSLGEAVSIAMRQSDEIGIAAAQTDIAEAQFGVARSSALPQLRFTSSYLKVYQSARGQAVGSVFNQPNTYTGNLNLTQTIFQGGRLISATRAADDIRQATRYDEREQRAQLTLVVQRAYLQVLFTDRIAQLQDQNLALASERLTQVEQFERAGRLARYDVLRARVERSNIEPQTIQARNDRELALVDLKRILNLPIEQPVSLVTRIDSASAAGLLAALQDTSVVADRASIRSAELNVAARRLGVSVARADFFPTLSVFFQTGYQAFPLTGLPTANGSLANDFCTIGTPTATRCQNGGWFSDRQAGVNVSMPVFDGFRVRSNVELAQAQTRLAELQLRQQREAVSVDVARARAELRRSSAVFAARQQNSAEADEAFRLATLRFSRGLSTQLEVSDSQLALLTARSTEARATYDLFLASADLARALGRPIPFSPATATLPASR
ncbi:MAG: outer rane efflux protein [Gemmatimonadetes bacterium]|nr:outer rane efflux protein [Gemmatimonadota bacterium]